MAFLVALVAFFLMSASGISAQDVHYVKPNNMSINSSSQPCLTLDQYAQQPATYFTPGSTFVFLAGYHSLQATVNITSTSNITFKAETDDSSIKIACINEVTILCDTVNNLTLQGLTFILDSNSILRDSSALHFFNCRSTLLASMFQGSGNLTRNSLRGIYSLYSALTIVSCHFEGNTGDYGGAIYASEGSNINLTGNTFIRNKAKYTGGAVYVKGSTITLKERLGNVFINNSGRISGGALNCKSSKLDVESHSSSGSNLSNGITSMLNEAVPKPGIQYFDSNEAEYGGAVYLIDSLSQVEGTAIVFRNNSAFRGGAIFMYSTGQSIIGRTVVTADIKHFYFTGNRAKECGGAIYSLRSYLILRNTTKNFYHFSLNSAGMQGGAIYNEDGRTTISGFSIFKANSVTSSSSSGGAIALFRGTLLLSGRAKFIMNKAVSGGAIKLYSCTASFRGTEIEFENNSAVIGGGITNDESEMIMDADRLRFGNNRAQSQGGALAIRHTDQS